MLSTVRVRPWLLMNSTLLLPAYHDQSKASHRLRALFRCYLDEFVAGVHRPARGCGDARAVGRAGTRAPGGTGGIPAKYSSGSSERFGSCCPAFARSPHFTASARSAAATASPRLAAISKLAAIATVPELPAIATVPVPWLPGAGRRHFPAGRDNALYEASAKGVSLRGLSHQHQCDGTSESLLYWLQVTAHKQQRKYLYLSCSYGRP